MLRNALFYIRLRLPRTGGAASAPRLGRDYEMPSLGLRLGLGRAWAAPGPRLGNAQPCLRSPRQAQPGRRAGRCLGAALSAAWHCYAAAQRGAVRRTRRRLGGRARALRLHFAYLNTPMLFEYHLNTI